MTIQEYQTRCYREYKQAVGLPEDYRFIYGNPVNVLVPIETKVGGVMVVGAYPSAKFATIQGITDVPVASNDAPFSSEIYFDGSRVRRIPSGEELEENYLRPLGISRAQCWITNLVKVFLFKPGHVNRYHRLGVRAIETRSWYRELAQKSLPWLWEEISLAQPKLIIFLSVDVVATVFGVSRNQATEYLDGQIRLLPGTTGTYQALCLPHPGILMKPSVRNPWPERFREEIIPRAIGEIQKILCR